MNLRCRLLAILVVAACLAHAEAWPDGRELAGRLLDLARLDRATVHEIGRSQGDQKLRVLEIAPARPRDGGDPAILVLANFEGNLPLCSLTATELAAEVLAANDEAAAARIRWYILPSANPDGLDRWFERPRTGDGRNRAPWDDDNDGLEGEDPPDDLDGDGLITWMLVEDQGGQWTLTDDDLPIAANAARGLAGRYRREIEGRDQDRDGRFNEDAPGGVDVARNFPHEFEPWSDAGRWPGDQPEARAVLEFAHDHPDIALILVLGATNNLWLMPEPQAETDLDQPVRVGWRLARSLDLSRDAEYPLRVVLDAVRERGARANLTPASVRAQLHLDPVTKPLPADLVWWGALSDSYHAFLREAGLDSPRELPAPPPAGGVAPWAYFQFGVPAVAIDLWSLPAPADTAAVDSVLAVVPDPTPEPDPVLARLKERTERNQHAGWRAWTRVTLDDGTAALVGGPEPGAVRTPAPYAAAVRSRALLPFLIELPDWLPRLAVDPLVVRGRGDDVHEVTAVVRNTGRLPYPTEMGALNRRPAPVSVQLTGGEILQGDADRVVPTIPAGGAATLRWLVRSDRPDRLTVTASAPSLGTVVVKGGSR